jgi:hypothetical protein
LTGHFCHKHFGFQRATASQSEETWTKFLESAQAELIQIAHRLHGRVVVEVFGKDTPHLTAREVECLRWVALGKGLRCLTVRVGDRTVRHLISTGYLSLESRDVAASVAFALEAWISDSVT